jgi:hypothetical protein
VDDKEVMQMALDWIEAQPEPRMIGAWERIKALRAALAQPEKTDMQIGLTYEEANPPVVWVDTLDRARPDCVTDFKYLSVAQVNSGEHLKYIPLYTAALTQPEPTKLINVNGVLEKAGYIKKKEWVGLTIEEINEVFGGEIYDENSGLLTFTRAIEAKLKDKNHG